MEDILKKYNFDGQLFDTLRKNYISGEFTCDSNIVKGKIELPNIETFLWIEKLDKHIIEEYRVIGENAIKKGQVGYVIVNGGMGTRFGSRPKGLIEVYDNKTFLQIKLEQIKKVNDKHSVSIKVYIMNSFATEQKTIELLEKNNFFGLDKNSVFMFNQFIFKRLTLDGNFFKIEVEPEKSYYGPGHGDFIYAFRQSGLLKEFIDSGGKYIMYSNVDNLGATIDEVIFGYHITQNYEMTVELVKCEPHETGGRPAIVDGKLQIVEDFKFPQYFDKEKIQVINTATYIFTVDALLKKIDLPFYVVIKKVEGQEVVQFERLTGDLSIFLNTGYIVTDRNTRFIPVKSLNDLENKRQVLKQLFG